MRVLRTVDVLGEREHHALHVLHPVPPRELYHQRRFRWRRRARLQDVDPAIDPSRRAVPSPEVHRHRLRRAAGEPDELQDRTPGLVGERLVLRGERVDARGDDVHTGRVRPVGRERASAEHVRVHVLEVGAQELPAPLRVLVRSVAPDVAPPHHLRARLAPQGRERGGLRVVKEQRRRRASRANAAPRRWHGASIRSERARLRRAVHRRRARRRGGCGCAS